MATAVVLGSTIQEVMMLDGLGSGGLVSYFVGLDGPKSIKSIDLGYGGLETLCLFWVLVDRVLCSWYED